MYVYIHTYIAGGGSAGIALLWWWRGCVVVYLCVSRVCHVSSVLCVSESSVIYAHAWAWAWALILYYNMGYG